MNQGRRTMEEREILKACFRKHWRWLREKEDYNAVVEFIVAYMNRGKRKKLSCIDGGMKNG